MTTTETTHGHGQGHAPAQADGEPMLYHHFDDLAQQHESSSLGMWAFLATEVLFFGGLFAAYAIYRNLYHNSFVAAGQHLNVVLGGVNTAVLLCSSLTMALAVRCAHLRQARPTIIYLILTMILGAGFLGIKAKEWYDDYQDHLMPGINFDWEKAQHGKHAARSAAAEPPEAKGTVHEIGPGEGKSVAPSASIRRAEAGGPSPLMPPPGGLLGEEPTSSPGGRAQLFFVLYFFMTGLHAIHLIVGIALVGVIAALVGRGWVSGTGSTHVEVTGLYWHFIDIVWVYLYPILYLIDIKP